MRTYDYEEMGLREAENRAFMNGVAWGDEPGVAPDDYDPQYDEYLIKSEGDEIYRQAMIELDEGWDEYEENLIEEMINRC